MRLALASTVTLLVVVSGPAIATELPIEVSGSGTHEIVVIENPTIDGDSYAVTGTVGYDGVGGSGYLEMWSHFADGSSFFSRALEADGPQGVLSGTSEGRPFSLPFFLGDAGTIPFRLEINVVLPSEGTVVVSDVQLESPIGGSGGWWDQQTGNVVGAVLGSLTGLLGAAIGIFARRSRRFALAAPKIGITWGVVLTSVGAVTFVIDQPHHVWYPLLLVGIITAAVLAAILPTIRRQQEHAELQRMHAMDA